MNKIQIVSKPEFNQAMGSHGINDSNVEEKFKGAAISINDTEGNWNVSWFDHDHENVLRFWFDDVEFDEQQSPTNPFTCRSFKEDQAKQVFAFVKKHADKDWVIHCSAGISRSGAIGTFILHYLEGDKEYFAKRNPHIHPNGHILRMLNKLAWEEKENG